jgi:TetR/AcrR family tetracycline transcriptional repressor
VGLNRAQIVDAAYWILREHGLGGLSMRRLAQDLGVQPGALYYHVASKQELLVAVADRILTGDRDAISTTDPGRAAAEIREALLRVRDGAEVVSFAHAFRPDTLGPFGELRRLFATQFPPRQARWAALTLIHYVFGFVTEEQSHTELVRAKILTDEPVPAAESSEAFMFGVNAIMEGLSTKRDEPRWTLHQ